MFKYRTGLLLIALLLCGAGDTPLARKKVPVEISVRGNDIYFVFDKPYELNAVWVDLVHRKPDRNLYNPHYWSWGTVRWGMVYNCRGRQPRKLMKELRYGQRFDQYMVPVQPKVLDTGMLYSVEIFLRAAARPAISSCASFTCDGYVRKMFIVDKSGEVVVLEPRKDIQSPYEQDGMKPVPAADPKYAGTN